MEKSLRQAYPELSASSDPLDLAQLLAQASAVHEGTFQLTLEKEDGPDAAAALWTASDEAGRLPVSGRGDSAEEAIAAWLLARLAVSGWNR